MGGVDGPLSAVQKPIFARNYMELLILQRCSIFSAGDLQDLNTVVLLVYLISFTNVCTLFASRKSGDPSQRTLLVLGVLLQLD